MASYTIYHQRYHEAHKAERNAAARDYIRAHPEKAREYAQRARAKKKQKTSSVEH